MDEAHDLRFGPFRLAGPYGPLTKYGLEVHVRPKACSVLWTLALKAGKVVPKAELFEKVWPRVIVGDDALAAQIQFLRRVLGDEARTPRYIATVHGVGFRFIARVDGPAHAPENRSATSISAPATPIRPLVGRESALEILRASFAQALLGQRQIVFVTGEAGIGKSALVDAFVDRSRASTLTYSHGRCMEQSSGTGEAFMPILEALGRLCRRNPRLVATLRELAPITLEQIGLPMSDAEREVLHRQAVGARPARVLRELADALDALSTADPLLLVLEDLHWSDVPTVDVLRMVARRRDSAKLMLLCTYRPVDAQADDHPVVALKQSLVSGGEGMELPLTRLDISDVTAYLTRRFPDYVDPDRLTALVYRRTEGHPLFMVHLADDLAEQPRDASLHAFEERIPGGLLDLIHAQLARLPAQLSKTLAAASVAGSHFDAAEVAAAMNLPLETVEDRCAQMARRGQFITDVGLSAWPDGTQSEAYEFRHVLYLQVLRKQIPSARQATLHRRIAERIEAAYGGTVGDVSPELAVHFESARIPGKAIHYRTLAARRAQERALPEEALDHARRGLGWIHGQPRFPDQVRSEFALLLISIHALSLIRGFGDPEIAHVLDRVEDLSTEVDDPVMLARALTFQWLFHHYHSRFGAAIACSEKMIDVGTRSGDPDAQCMGLAFQSVSLRRRGQYRGAEALSQKALNLPKSPDRHGWRAQTSNAPAATALISQALTRWLLGFPDQSVERMHAAIADEENHGSPYSLCGTLGMGAVMVLVYRRDPGTLLETCDKAIALCERHHHTEGLAFATKYRGIALCMLDRIDEGLAIFRRIIQAQHDSGISHTRIFDYCHEAEYCIAGARLHEGRAALERAFAGFNRQEDRIWEPELLRVEGELLLAEKTSPRAAAQERFRSAIALARSQEARSFELRAATALARAMVEERRPIEGLALLQPVYATFTEGFDTPDLKTARALIERIDPQRAPPVAA